MIRSYVIFFVLTFHFSIVYLLFALMYYFFKSFSSIIILLIISLSMQLSIYGEIATAIFVEIGEESLYSAECFRILVGTSGLEPPTSRLSGVCSNQLSYVPV